MKFLFLFFSVLSVHLAYTQDKHDYDDDSIHLQLKFKEGLVKDTGDMSLKLIYTNKLNRPILVYKKCTECDAGQIFCNIYIELEKLKDKNYSSFNYRSHDYVLPNPLVDSIRHYDIPKQSLCPKCIASLNFNLLDVTGFDSGSYRFKVWVRIETTMDDTPYTDTTLATNLPLDSPGYFISDWLYFETTKRIIFPRRNSDTGEFEVARSDSSYFYKYAATR